MNEEKDDVMDGNSGATERASTSMKRSSPAFVPGKRVLSKTVRERQLKKLSPSHHEIAERLIAGQRPKDIAREMDIGSQWLSVVMNSPLFVDHLEKRMNQRSLLIDVQVVDRKYNEAVRDKMDELEAWSRRVTRKYRPYFRTQARHEKEQADNLERSVREALRGRTANRGEQN